MPEVSGSSSRVASAVKSTAGFDLQTQSGVANLLKKLRASGLSSQTKATVREMVLRYAQTGGDAVVQGELEAILSGLSLLPSSDSKEEVQEGSDSTDAVPTKTESKVEARKTFGFSSGRPVPSFIKPKSTKEPMPKLETTPNPPLVEPTPIVDSVSPVTPPLVARSIEPVVPSVTVPDGTAAPAQATPATPEKNNLDRILEIKREVITLVGNPVNLVDIDNAVGKQYMTTLLEAMKKTNGGTKEEATEAMKNLEKAFVAVKGVFERGLKPDFEPEAEFTPNQIPVTEATPATPTTPNEPVVEVIPPTVIELKPEPTPIIPPPPPISSTTQEQSTPVVAEGIKENLVQDEEIWKKVAAEQVSESAVDETKPVVQTEERQLGGAPLQDIPTYGSSKPTRSIGLPQKTKKSNVVDQPAGVQTPPLPPSINNPVPTSVKGPTQVQRNEMADDLMSPDITVGLSQLLSEWKIFKGSGLFGMGPGGIDHPLYVGIKDNTMLSIMNGTFTGATSEIQQSINDYINGWRYEQSIVPQHSETFEHFLRRVVRKVLKDAKR